MNKNSVLAPSRIGLALMLGLAVTTTGPVASAAILLNDTFADGSRVETNLPNESAVWLSHAGSTAVGPGSVAFTQSASSQKLWTHFAADGAEVNLAVGDTLIATIDFTPRGGLYANTSRGFRFGLFNDPTDAQLMADVNSDDGQGRWSDSTGYAVLLALNSDGAGGTGAQLGKRTGSGSLLGSTGVYSLITGGSPVVNAVDTQYTLTLELERAATDVMNVSFSIADAGGIISSHSVIDDPTGAAALGAGPIATTFEHLFFRFSNNTTSADVIDINRIQVEHVAAIPEPATAAIALVGAAALLRRRR
jgi:hypothetical protein